MKYLKKALKLIGFVLLMTMASVGLGFNAAMMPNIRRDDTNEDTIELVKTDYEESGDENQEIP